MRTRKETSECKVRAALIQTESTGESGASCTAIEVCWGTTRSRLHTCGDGSHVSFLSQSGAPQLPPRWLHRAHVKVTLQQGHYYNQRYSKEGELIGSEHTGTLTQWLSSVIVKNIKYRK